MCEIFGIFGKRKVRDRSQEAMVMLQGTMYSSAGLAFSDGRGFECEKTGSAFNSLPKPTLNDPGIGVGWIQFHKPGTALQNVNSKQIQPFTFNVGAGPFCIAIRGNNVNQQLVQDRLTLSVGKSSEITSDALIQLTRNLGDVTMILATPKILFGYAGIDAPLFMLTDSIDLLASDEATFDKTARKRLKKIEPHKLVVITPKFLYYLSRQKNSQTLTRAIEDESIHPSVV